MEEKQALKIFENEKVKEKFQQVLGEGANSYITSALTIISQNDLLSKADGNSVYLAVLQSAIFKLSLNPSLGYVYIIPYNCKENNEWKTKAQFQLGYKGLIQLAQRSGQYTMLSDTAIYEGQIKDFNPLTGHKFDFSIKPVGEPIGFCSYFKLVNGFEKYFYMSVEDLKNHGLKFSQTFKKGFGNWKDNFEAMCLKTVLKLSLSKYGPLSMEMQRAIEVDQGILNENGVEFVDNDQKTIDEIDLEEKIKELKVEKKEVEIIQETPDIF